MNKCRCLIADDHPMVRDALVSALAQSFVGDFFTQPHNEQGTYRKDDNG